MIFFRLNFLLLILRYPIISREQNFLQPDIIKKINKIQNNIFNPLDENDFDIYENFPKDTLLKIKKCLNGVNINFLPEDIYAFFTYGLHKMLNDYSMEILTESLFKSLIYSECFDHFLRKNLIEFEIPYLASEKYNSKVKIKHNQNFYKIKQQKPLQKKNNQNVQYINDNWSCINLDLSISFSGGLCEFLIEILDNYCLKIYDICNNYCIFSTEISRNSKKIIKIEFEKIKSKKFFKEFQTVEIIIFIDFALINLEFTTFILNFKQIILRIDFTIFNKYEKTNIITHDFINSFFIFVNEFLKKEIHIIIRCGNLLKKHTKTGYVEIEEFYWIGDTRLAYIHCILFDSIIKSGYPSKKDNIIFKDFFDLITPNINKRTSDSIIKDVIKNIEILLNLLFRIIKRLELKNHKLKSYYIEYSGQKTYKNLVINLTNLLNGIHERLNRKISLVYNIFDFFKRSNRTNEVFKLLYETIMLKKNKEEFETQNQKNYPEIEIEEKKEIEEILNCLKLIILIHSKENTAILSDLSLLQNLYSNRNLSEKLPSYVKKKQMSINQVSNVNSCFKISMQYENGHSFYPFVQFGTYDCFCADNRRSNDTTNCINLFYHGCFNIYFLIHRNFIFLLINENKDHRIPDENYSKDLKFFEFNQTKNFFSPAMIHLKRIQHLSINLYGNFIAKSIENLSEDNGSEIIMHSCDQSQNFLFLNMICRITHTIFFKGKVTFISCELMSMYSKYLIMFANDFVNELELKKNTIIHNLLFIYGKDGREKILANQAIFKHGIEIHLVDQFNNLHFIGCSGNLKIDNLELNHIPGIDSVFCTFIKSFNSFKIMFYDISGIFNCMKKNISVKIDDCLLSATFRMKFHTIFIKNSTGTLLLEIVVIQTKKKYKTCNLDLIKFNKNSILHINLIGIHKFLVFINLIFLVDPTEFIFSNNFERMQIIDCYILNDKNQVRKLDI